MIKWLKRRQLAAMRRERRSKYKIVRTLCFEQLWSDESSDYVSIYCYQNDLGQRKVEIGWVREDYLKDMVKKSKWWNQQVIPWMHNQPITSHKEENKNNVVKLKLVNNDET